MRADEQIRLDRWNFKQPLLEMFISTWHDSYQPDAQKDFQLLRDHIHDALTIRAKNNRNIPELIASFPDLKYHLSKRICDVLPNRLAQISNV